MFVSLQVHVVVVVLRAFEDLFFFFLFFLLFAYAPFTKGQMIEFASLN